MRTDRTCKPTNVAPVGQTPCMMHVMYSLSIRSVTTPEQQVLITSRCRVDDLIGLSLVIVGFLTEVTGADQAQVMIKRK